MPEAWERMSRISVGLLEKRTGFGLEEWNRRVRGSGADRDEASLRAWLAREGVSGYPQMLLVFERFGYPDYLVASAGELIDAQYADRPGLRPILDRIIELASTLGEVRVQARKGYVTLVGPRRTFALVNAPTRRRVDLGLRLEGGSPGGRLLRAGRMPQGWATVKVELTAPDEVDGEVLDLLSTTYQANL
jgi:hypothetical protein